MTSIVQKLAARKLLFGVAAIALLVLAGSFAIAQGPQSTGTYEVTFAGRHLSIPNSYFQGAPGHDDENGLRQGLLLRYLWPSMEGKTSRNASAFSDPYMPVNNVLMHHVPKWTDEQLVASAWSVLASGYEPSQSDRFEGSFQFADNTRDDDGYPIDIYYRLDLNGAVAEFLTCDLFGAGGHEYPNPGCRHVFADEGILYQTHFRLHLRSEANAMKTAWLAKMHEFEDKQ